MVKKTVSSTVEIPILHLEEEKFSPFGDVISACPSRMRYINRGATKRYHDLARIESHTTHASVLFNIFRCDPFSIPIDITMMERHPYGSQAFYPVLNYSFLVVVAEDKAGIPQKPQAFMTQVGQGVNYRVGTWHHPLLAIEKTSDFIVVDWADQENNLEEYFYDTIYRVSNLENEEERYKI